MAKKDKINIDKNEIDELVLDTIKFHCADTIYFKDKESRFLWNSQQHADQFTLLRIFIQKKTFP